MGGLSHGLYFDFARDCAKKYLAFLFKEMEDTIEVFDCTRKSDVVKRNDAVEYMDGYVDGLKKMQGLLRGKIEEINEKPT